MPAKAIIIPDLVSSNMYVYVEAQYLSSLPSMTHEKKAEPCLWPQFYYYSLAGLFPAQPVRTQSKKRDDGWKAQQVQTNEALRNTTCMQYSTTTTIPTELNSQIQGSGYRFIHCSSETSMGGLGWGLKIANGFVGYHHTYMPI